MEIETNEGALVQVSRMSQEMEQAVLLEESVEKEEMEIEVGDDLQGVRAQIIKGGGEGALGFVRIEKKIVAATV